MCTTRSPVALVLFAIATLTEIAGCALERPPGLSGAAPRTDERCAIVPLQLTLTAPGRAALSILSLDARGAFGTGSSDAPLGVLDERGCLVVAGNTELEALGDGSVWSANARYEFRGSELRLTEDRSMWIRSDGVVETRANGTLEPSQQGRLAFVGYSKQAACAARVMLAVFMASVPSMAASDGVLPVLPPPPGSHCPHVARP